MVSAPASLTPLPDNFASLPVEQAVQVLLRNVIHDDATYFELARRNAALIHWIEQQP